MDIHIRPSDEIYKYILPLVDKTVPKSKGKLNFLGRAFAHKEENGREDSMHLLEKLGLIEYNSLLEEYTPKKFEILEDKTIVLYDIRW